MAADELAVRLGGDAPHLSIGILTADLGHLADELVLLESAGMTMVHTDVMDGIWCPMLTVGPPFVAAQRTRLLKDVHLMIEEPLEKVGQFVRAGADLITFQVESASNPRRVLRILADAQNENDASRGIIRGIAVNPGTPLEVVEPLLPDLEYVLLLAIDPGWSGQRFSPSTPARVDRLRAMIRASGRRLLIGIDGGVTKGNIAEVAVLGVDIVVSGSAVFDGTGEVAANAAFMRANVALG